MVINNLIYAICLKAFLHFSHLVIIFISVNNHECLIQIKTSTLDLLRFFIMSISLFIDIFKSKLNGMDQILCNLDSMYLNL